MVKILIFLNYLNKKFLEGVQQIATLQNHLISERLLDWKNCQKLSQIGVPYDNRDNLLDDIQNESVKVFFLILHFYFNYIGENSILFCKIFVYHLKIY